MTWNSRYVAYAQAHGKSPDEMLEFDRERCPGGHMAEFIIWIGQKWSLWRAANSRHRDAALSDADHANFNSWLENKST